MAFCCTGVRPNARLECPGGLTLHFWRTSSNQDVPPAQLEGLTKPIVLMLHEVNAHVSPPSNLKRRPGLFHVVSSSEPPHYNALVFTDEESRMSRFDLGLTFLARPPHHVPQPYPLMRDSHHVFTKLRLGFHERHQPCASNRAKQCGGLFAVGNCAQHMAFPRAKILRAIMNRMPIDAIGSCHKNTPNFTAHGEKEEEERLYKYKFLLAFENSVRDCAQP